MRTQNLRVIYAVIISILAVGAGPATRPTTQPSFIGTWQQMRDELAMLRVEVEKLRAENKLLRLRLGVPEASSPIANFSAALRDERPEIGMTIEQWKGASQPDKNWHFSARKIGADRRGDIYFLWTTGPFGAAAEWTAIVVAEKIVSWGPRER